jgi:RNA polymerase sigma factor (TIGR02999 family)
MSLSENQATLLLGRLNCGDEGAARELLPLLYDELRTLAARQFRGQPAGHTLQPTVLVHEAFLRLVGHSSGGWKDRHHFFAVAATAMRQILVNHARAKNAGKRGGGGPRPLLLNDDVVGVGSQNLDVLDLNDAMERLAAIDPRKHRVVELRFFAGLTVPEVAEVVAASVTTVESDWRAAKAWLSVELSR